ncbi:MAG TPA: hypothetical protein VNA30_03015 [Mycobacteriales bacterium]|nr:hypothetical protein [Mycobacteriales bacterium]
MNMPETPDGPLTDDLSADLEPGWWNEPDVLAISAFVLAVLSLGGLGVLNGSAYLGAPVTSPAGVVLTSLLGVLFAVVPVLAGLRAATRVLAGDPAWVGALARSAVLLGALSVVLRVSSLVAAYVNDGADFARF